VATSSNARVIDVLEMLNGLENNEKKKCNNYAIYIKWKQKQRMDNKVEMNKRLASIIYVYNSPL